jgi:hypothetical protein
MSTNESTYGGYARVLVPRSTGWTPVAFVLLLAPRIKYRDMLGPKPKANQHTLSDSWSTTPFCTFAHERPLA